MYPNCLCFLCLWLFIICCCCYCCNTATNKIATAFTYACVFVNISLFLCDGKKATSTFVANIILFCVNMVIFWKTSTMYHSSIHPTIYPANCSLYINTHTQTHESCIRPLRCNTVFIMHSYFLLYFLCLIPTIFPFPLAFLLFLFFWFSRSFLLCHFYEMQTWKLHSILFFLFFCFFAVGLFGIHWNLWLFVMLPPFWMMREIKK